MKVMQNMDKEYTILDEFFNYREEELAEDIEEDIKCLKDKLKDVRQENIVANIEKLPDEDKELKKELLLQLDDLIANYNIKIAYYNKKYYKQGFQDAIRIQNSCNQMSENKKERPS